MPVAQRTAMSTQCLQPRTANISSAAAGLRNGFGLRNSPSTAAALSVNKRLRSRCRCTPGEPFYEACQRSEFQDRADRATAGALDHSVPATPGATHRATVPGNGAPLGARPQARKGKAASLARGSDEEAIGFVERRSPRASDATILPRTVAPLCAYSYQLGNRAAADNCGDTVPR
jgi:hypothetical protein